MIFLGAKQSAAFLRVSFGDSWDTMMVSITYLDTVHSRGAIGLLMVFRLRVAESGSENFLSPL
jgi:hypothetical protein